MAPVDSRDYVLSGIYYSAVKPLMCEARCGLSTHPANTGRWPSIKTALVQSLVFAELRSIAAGLVILTAGGEYKPTSTQCLLNVGPASPVLASIYSALVSTSCWRYRHDGLNQSWTHIGPPCLLSIVDGGSTLAQHWVNVSCLLGRPETSQ